MHIQIGDQRVESEDAQHLTTLFELAIVCAREGLPLAVDADTCILMGKDTPIRANIPGAFANDANHTDMLKQIRRHRTRRAAGLGA